MQGIIGGLAIVAVVIMLLGAGWKRKLFGEADLGPIRSVAVLPLQNLSNDANQEYFVDGMTDELITDLAQIRELKVVVAEDLIEVAIGNEVEVLPCRIENGTVAAGEIGRDRRDFLIDQRIQENDAVAVFFGAIANCLPGFTTRQFRNLWRGNRSPCCKVWQR